MIGKEKRQTDHQYRVEEFMLRAGQAVPERPEVPRHGIMFLRASLILEEALETIEAMGFSLRVREESGLARTIGRSVEVEPWPVAKPDLVKIADGCGDLSVVAMGTLSACGIQDQAVLEEIDESNLSKVSDGCELREDGKILKGRLYQPPDIEGVLKEQGWEGSKDASRNGQPH